MATNYPGAIPPATLPARTDPAAWLDSQVWDEIRAALVELGTNPSGANFATVAEAIAAMARQTVFVAGGNSGSSKTLDMAGLPPDVIWDLNLNAASVTLGFSNVPTVATLNILLTQGVSTDSFVVWPSGSKWVNASEGILSTTVGAMDIVWAFTKNGGTTWYLAMVGQFPA